MLSNIYFGDKTKTLNYSPKADEMVMTVHRWFANKSCPGDYLYNLHGKIAEEVTKQLGGTASASSGTSASAASSSATSAAKTSTAVKKTLTQTLRYLGKTGYTNSTAQVKTVQRLLNALGFKGKDGKTLAVDGDFGVNTEYAVKAFQKKKNVAADGVVGPVTWKLLLGAE